jgi:hypothetical protein
MASLWPLLEARGVAASAGRTAPHTATPEAPSVPSVPVRTDVKSGQKSSESSSKKTEPDHVTLSRKKSIPPQAPASTKPAPFSPRNGSVSPEKIVSKKQLTRRIDFDDAKDEEVVDIFAEIIQSEGPVLCSRVYDLCLQMAGLTNLSMKLKSRFNTCMYRGVREGRFLQTQDDAVGQLDRTVRMPGVPAVIVRLDGKRRWQEVPRSELRAFAEQKLSADPKTPEEELIREVFAAYGGKRLDKQATQELGELLRPVLQQRLLKL